MTKDEALTVALQQIEVAVEYIDHLGGESGMYRAALVGLKKALAQEQEPVANIRTWHKMGEQHAELWNWCAGLERLPDGDYDVYTSPPQRHLESTTDMMMELADRLGELPEDIDPRAWGHLLVYVPKRPWVGLTEEEIEDAIKSCNTTDTYKYFRAIEAKLKEKNT